jgi:beta-galactosidase
VPFVMKNAWIHRHPVLLIAALAACRAPEPTPEPDFDEDFAFGTATAGFQVDMGCPTWTPEQCDDPASDWYAWVNDPAIVAEPALFMSGDPVSAGPGMWETFEDDVALMQADGLTSYRLSLEWSRLFPTGEAGSATTVDELVPHASTAAITRYHQMFSALRDAGITPVVTVNHYTLPLWVHDGVTCHTDLTCEASGWLNRDRIIPWIALYSGFVAREFGGEVDTWFTLNEPFATTLSGYLQPGEDRSAPPGVNFEVDATVAVMLHQIDGHAAMYDALKAEDTRDADGDGVNAEVGIVMNMVAIEPRDPENPLDVQGAAHADYLYHALYLDAVTDGSWDDDLDGTPDRVRPELAGRLDLLGVNYYNRMTVAGFPFAPVEQIPAFDFLPEFSWEPYPTGLTSVLQRASAWGVPVVVTENGTPYVEDRGVEVLDGHLAAVHEAIDAGVDVRGYHYWSFVDNYEWNHGFGLRFGLYELDPVTKARVPRPVRDRFVSIATTRALTP